MCAQIAYGAKNKGSENKRVALGRPPKAIDWNKVDLYIKAGCTGLEIAAEFDMHHATFYEKVIEKYGMHLTALTSHLSPAGELNLRVKQFQEAMQGNTKMLQILGEERLGQGKKVDTSLIPSQDAIVDKDNENMSLKAQIAKLNFELEELRKKIDNEPQARQELPGSDTPL